MNMIIAYLLTLLSMMGLHQDMPEQTERSACSVSSSTQSSSSNDGAGLRKISNGF